MFRIFLFLAAVFCSLSTQASDEGKTTVPKKGDKILTDVTYACLSDSAAGLNWDGSHWQSANFKPYEKFLMTVTEIHSKSLNKTFIHFVLKGEAIDEHCGAEMDEASAFFEGTKQCLQKGMAVYFMPANGRGALSYMLGAISIGASRSSLAVMPFTCEKF